MTLDVPAGWTVWGDLPTPEAPESAGGYLSEDLWIAESPGGEITIHVGWYGRERDPGSFGIQVVRDRDWEFPIEEVSVPSINLVTSWLVRALPYYERKLGRVARPERRRRARSRMAQLGIAERVPSSQTVVRTIRPVMPPCAGGAVVWMRRSKGVARLVSLSASGRMDSHAA